MKIRQMTAPDTEQVIEMMRMFYSSPAVYTNGSEEIFQRDVENCVNDNPYLEGYVLEEEGEVCGYAMLAKSFSTEFGKPCLWIEDIFIKEEYRGRGMGSEFLSFVEKKYPGFVLRLEAEEENVSAVHVYRKRGFDTLPYMEMKKDNGYPLPCSR